LLLGRTRTSVSRTSGPSTSPTPSPRPSTAEAVAALKERQDDNLVVFGSGVLVQSLMRRDLIDEYVLQLHPLVLGSGRRLFPDEIPPATFRLADTGGQQVPTNQTRRRNKNPRSRMNPAFGSCRSWTLADVAALRAERSHRIPPDKRVSSPRMPILGDSSIWSGQPTVAASRRAGVPRLSTLTRIPRSSCPSTTSSGAVAAVSSRAGCAVDLRSQLRINRLQAP